MFYLYRKKATNKADNKTNFWRKEVIPNDLFCAIFLDPVRLLGEGQYNLNNLKEIVVTESFMGLNKDARNCQSNETFDDCKTNLYIKNLREQCGCLPFSSKSQPAEKVQKDIHFLWSIPSNIFTDHPIIYQFQDTFCSKNEEIECSQKISPFNSTNCIR